MNATLIKKHVATATMDRIDAAAQYRTEQHFFCNVGEDEYPEDVVAVLDKMPDDEVVGAEVGGAVVWEPYENDTVGDLLQKMDDFQRAEKALMLEAVSFQLENDEYCRSVG